MGRGAAEKPKLKIPYCQGEEDDAYYTVNTLEEKTVADYTGYNFDRIEELTVFEFWLYLRDAAIYKYSQTEGGCEYLEKCRRMEQTKPDRKALRKKMGKQ